MAFPQVIGLFTSLFVVLSALIAAVFVPVLVRYYFAAQRPKNFPPGPQTIPFLGNLHLLPPSKIFLKFDEWAKDYGPIVGLKFGPQNVVVLNSFQHVKELFDKKGAIYSSRPENYIGNEIICQNETHILLVPYGQGWRTLRKACQSLLNVKIVDSLLPIQNAEASQTMLELLQSPGDCYNHIRRYSTGVILASVFGQRGAKYESAKVQALYHAQEQFTEILAAGATPPVDAFPFLKSLPAFLRDQRPSSHKKTTPCFLEQVLKEREKSGMDDEHIAYLGGTLMEAGSDTTSSTLLSFLLAVIQQPEILEKAQKEVDAVCGTERSPAPNDLDKLSYLRACMTETLRWRPVAPGGVPHSLIEDDIYHGYFLPKGTMLFAYTWSIHRDITEYDRADNFVPERFLRNKFGTRIDNEPDMSDDHRRVTYAFGAGRRVCPGQRLAENSLILNMAKLSWGFNILSSPDSSAKVDASVSTGYSDGFIVSPKKFPAWFTPRSDKHREVIMREFDTAKATFALYED
ncbi:hypothetical protein MMC08_002023 [Hypocenomyce scalaris]|nr:hypothetical protein [Hypocenomyce scalaris]